MKLTRTNAPLKILFVLVFVLGFSMSLSRLSQAGSRQNEKTLTLQPVNVDALSPLSAEEAKNADLFQFPFPLQKQAHIIAPALIWNFYFPLFQTLPETNTLLIIDLDNFDIEYSIFIS